MDLTQNQVNSTTSASFSSQNSGASTNPVITPKGSIINIKEISPGVYQATTDASKYMLEYDVNKCIGAASCAAIAPLTFFMNEENKAELIKDGTWDDDDSILSASQSCPVFAIKIILKDTNELIFPIDELY